MSLKKGDFIEIEFTGKLKDGDIFDSNIKEDLAKLNPKAKAKPFIMRIGEDMFLKGIDEFLIGKKVGEYEVSLTPEKAFGKRDMKLIQRMPLKVFTEQKINPVAGASFNFDGKIGKVLTSSGGRVIVDFNNPLAGKDVVYKVIVKRVVEDRKEQIAAFIEFLFRKPLKFEVKDKKLIVYADKGMSQFIMLFKDKFKEVFDLDLEGKEDKSQDPPKSQ
jgi:FKBP-type peptidyl-prolyl cis-trans isomerase 2